jgi:hypothetical protein
VTIKIIVSIRHVATANATLLLPPQPRCCRISKRAAATAEILLPPSCHLRRQVGHHRRAVATANSAAALPLPRYHCLQNNKKM